MTETSSGIKSRAAFWLLRVLVPLLPALMMILLARIQWQANITDAHLYWSDELINWHQVATFKEYGFDGGYYTIAEHPAKASFSRFYVHGPWYPIIYGSMTKLIGWEIYTGSIVNGILLAVALAFFVVLTRLNIKQLLLLAGVLITAYPMHIYSGTNMQESMNQAFAVLAAIIFFFVFQHQEKLPARWKIAFASFLFVITVIRLSWGILLLPFFLFINAKNWRGIMIALGESAVSILLAMQIVAVVTPPGLHFILDTLESFQVSMEAGIAALSQQFQSNLELYLDLENKVAIDSIQTVQMISLIVIFAIITPIIIIYARNRRPMPRPAQAFKWYESTFHLYNLAAIILANLFLYIVASWQDFRIIYVHLLLTVLLLIARKSYWVVVAFLIITFFGFRHFPYNYAGYTAAKFNVETAPIYEFAGLAREHIRYDGDEINPWCNTILMPVKLLTGSVVEGIPPGIGTTIFFDIDDVDPIRSQYIWLHDEQYQQLQHRTSPPKLALLFSTKEFSSVYKNLDAGCSPG